MLATACSSEVQVICLLNEGLVNEAEQLLDVLLKKNSPTANTWFFRSYIRHSRSEWAAALKDIEMAMTLMPLPPAGQLILAECYAKTGRLALALFAYENLASLENLNAEYYVAIIKGLQICGRYEQAVEISRVAIETHPDDDHAYFLMANCMATLGYSASFVASILRKACELKPTDSSYRLALSVALVRSGSLEEAYKNLCRTSPWHIEAIESVSSINCIHKLAIWANDKVRSSTAKYRLDQIVSLIAHRALPHSPLAF